MTHSTAAGHPHRAVDGQPRETGPCEDCGEGPASPLHPPAQPFQPYEVSVDFPEEPPELSVAVGRSGTAYQRCDTPGASGFVLFDFLKNRPSGMWRSLLSDPARPGISWPQLLAGEFPLLIVHRGDPARAAR